MTDPSSPSEAARPVVLCILDGWGLRDETQDNAIALGSTPNWDRLILTCPTAQLACSGADVGLPDGQMGNSEVGHLNLGAGRVVWQDLPRINRAIDDGSLCSSPTLQDFIAKLKASGGTCHLVGLVSPGGVHAHQEHIAALAKIVSAAGVTVHIHALTDGRDTAPESAAGYVARLELAIAGVANIQISTVCGRYFAMDRDNRWERVSRAYNLIVSGEANGSFVNACDAIKASYASGTTDEFIEPVRRTDYGGMREGDGILYANFRADRVRELLSAILEPAFDGFERSRTATLAAALGMVTYSDRLGEICETIFPPVPVANTLGEVVARAGRRQLRAAETEKYPHVTYFFNGGEETPNDGEERLLVPSPKVATYDLQPEMSAPELTEKLAEKIRSNAYDVFIINYANGDMVGHTGDLSAAKRAVETVDASIGILEKALLEVGGTMLIIADHGNCETMFDREAGVPHTAHTLNPVPAVLVNCQRKGVAVVNGRLADVAPTILDLMGLEQPEDMTGASLLNTTRA
ncbi:MAG: 2,3-bisphosphoglycerate-independent phosphoglycerate mutase [Pseudomonadota bacterium]